MYALKTLLPQFEIEIPNCMYTMRNISLAADDVCGLNNRAIDKGDQQDISKGQPTAPKQSNCVASDIFSISNCTQNFGGSSSACALDLDSLRRQIQSVMKFDTAGITLRQETVLQQLAELREQLAAIRSTLDLCSKEAQPDLQSERSVQLNEEELSECSLRDIVINSPANYIPYALLVLQNAWKDLFNIEVNTFTHSSVEKIGPDVLDFVAKLKRVPVDSTKPKLKVTLIWKNCEHIEMLSSPTMYVPIYGEVNVIRYLARIGPNAYRYEDLPFCNEIDIILDICHQLLRCTTAKSKSNLIRSLSTRLNNQQYFAGSKFSIADIAAYSTLKHIAVVEKDMTPPLIGWQKRLQAIAVI